MSEYTLLWPIDQGGMATVWEARYKLPSGAEIPVACKIMHERVQDAPDGPHLFGREIDISLRLAARHPNIVPARGWFEVDGKLCLVMDLIEGCSLDRLMQPVRLPYSLVRRVAMHVLDALAYLHARDILHRDVSPSNILVSSHGDVLLTDFGLSKRMPEGHARSSSFRGKFAYAAPEVMNRGRVDARTDLYSFGAMLYELLCGDLPSGDAESFTAILRHRESGTTPELPADVPPELRALAMGLLARAPDDRQPQTAAAARDRLCANGEDLGQPGDLGRLARPIYERMKARRAARHTPRAILVPDALTAPMDLDLDTRLDSHTRASQRPTVIPDDGDADRDTDRDADRDSSADTSEHSDGLRDTQTARSDAWHAQLADAPPHDPSSASGPGRLTASSGDIQPDRGPHAPTRGTSRPDAPPPIAHGPRRNPGRRSLALTLLIGAAAAVLGYLARGHLEPSPAHHGPVAGSDATVPMPGDPANAPEVSQVLPPTTAEHPADAISPPELTRSSPRDSLERPQRETLRQAPGRRPTRSRLRAAPKHNIPITYATNRADPL